MLLRDLGAVGDAEQHVVGLELVRGDEVHVVGRDQRQVARERELDQRGLDRVLGGRLVAHQLDVEAAREARLEVREPGLGELAVALQQRLADRAFGAAGQRDQAAAVGGEVVRRELGRAAGLAAEVGAAQQLEEVLVALPVLHQDRQQRRRRRPAVGAARAVVAQRQQRADQRLDAGLGGVLAGAQRVEQVGAVGDADRRHRIAPAALEQRLEAHRALEQRERRADPQMDEGRVGTSRAAPRAREDQA